MCKRYIPLAPQDYQKNLASGKSRAALERFIATSSVAIGIHAINKKNRHYFCKFVLAKNKRPCNIAAIALMH
jgi:hypothetical protein